MMPEGPEGKKPPGFLAPSHIITLTPLGVWGQRPRKELHENSGLDSRFRGNDGGKAGMTA